MKNSFSVAVVFAAAFVFFLLFNGNISVTDPVESNYALTAKEMLLSGDWLSPRIYGQFWFDKPIMIYWLIAVSYGVFGVNEFAARFPAALFAAASVAWVYWFGGKLYASQRTAFFSALVLATSLEFWILSRMIITDAVLFFFHQCVSRRFLSRLAYSFVTLVYSCLCCCGISSSDQRPCWHCHAGSDSYRVPG